MAKKLVFHRAREEFDGFDWDPINREVHFVKHGIDFPIVSRVDWDRIKKAPDTRRVYDPPRSVAIARCPIIDRCLVIVYSKSNRIGRIISIRLANAEEENILNA